MHYLLVLKRHLSLKLFQDQILMTLIIFVNSMLGEENLFAYFYIF